MSANRPYGLTHNSHPDGPSPGVMSAREAAGGDVRRAANLCYRIEEQTRLIESGADHYAVLGVDRRATVEEIHTCFRGLVKVFHPDVHGDFVSGDAVIKIRLAVILARAAQSRAVLTDAHERAVYDQKLVRQSVRTTGALACKSPGR